MFKYSSLAFLVLVPLAVMAAEQRPLSLEEIYSPDSKVDLGKAPPRNPKWINERTFVLPEKEGTGFVTLAGDVDRTAKYPLFETERLERAVRDLTGVSPEEAHRISHQDSYDFDARGETIALAIEGALYRYNPASNVLKRLTAGKGGAELPQFSPDGRMLAFVRDRNLVVLDLETGVEIPLTDDRDPDVLNGKLDWLYQEEIFGRGEFRAFWWSPDSKRIAYLRLEEAKVPRFPVVDHIPYAPGLESTHYPQPGDPNPTVRLMISGGRGEDAVEVRMAGRYADDDLLVVNVGWKPDSSAVVFEAQNRVQSWLDVNSADPVTGSIRNLFRETTKTWVDADRASEWLPDGSFLWLSERTGFNHIYHYRADGTLIEEITNGPWEVRELYGVDSAGWIYYSGTEQSSLDLDVYRIRLDGSRKTRLSSRAGTHDVTFSPDFRYYLDRWSDVTTPTQLHLRKSDGALVRIVENNPLPLSDYRLSAPEFLTVNTRDGFAMNAMIIRPPDFDPTRKYPVYEHTYSGPHAPQVRNEWQGKAYLFHQLLAQRGIIVWICDNRTASGKGAVSTWPIYRNFGELELRDLEDGIAWLKNRGYVDGSRILLNGWSYGGFMVNYAMTHSKTWSAGIAGGSVTDWHDYDSVYTERYMLTPDRNPDGYRKSSPRFAAENLNGRLLLIHGSIDDNVHLQNTIQMAYALQKAGKEFELMIYPKSRHGVDDPQLVYHLRRLMLSFVERNLLSSIRE